MCQRSSDPFYIVTYYMNWVTTTWTHSMSNLEERGRKDRKRRGERHKKLEEQKENLNIMKK